MKAILRKGMAACAAVLMGANVMAQGNMFVENIGATFSADIYFMPKNLTYDGAEKLVRELPEEYTHEEYGNATCDIGFQVLDQDLTSIAEFKLYTVDEILNTRMWVDETLDENGNWVENYRYTNEVYLDCFAYRDVDCNAVSTASVSQTLFNDDEKYEAVVPVYNGTVIYQVEGSNRRTVYKNYVSTEIKIVNESGETLHTLQAGEGSFFNMSYGNTHFIKIGDKIYFSVPMGSTIAEKEWWYENCTSYRWYEICKETNSINFVRETRATMNITPTIANRDTQITITLNDENSNVARELIVTGVNGQLVEHRDIPAGENSVQIPASMLRSGMYNFTLQQKGQVVDNGKVIVK